MESLLSLLFLAGFSALAFWQKNAVLFLLTAGLALITGLSWYDSYGSSRGLTISLILIAYSIVCLIATGRCLFISTQTDEEEE